ncbi:MAG: hypothetical protein WD894_19200 [Pirellulales bacterium]
MASVKKSAAVARETKEKGHATASKLRTKDAGLSTKYGVPGTESSSFVLRVSFDIRHWR